MWKESTYDEVIEYDDEGIPVKTVPHRAWWLHLASDNGVVFLNAQIIETDYGDDIPHPFSRYRYDLLINGMSANWKLSHDTLESAKAEAVRALQKYVDVCKEIVTNYVRLRELEGSQKQ